MIRVSTDDAIAVIAFDRPDKRNALLPRMLDGLVEHIEHCRDARAIVLTGEGKAFCAGFDLEACLADPAVLDALLIGLHRAIEALRSSPCPVVAAAHGSAIAGGCALLGGADAVVSNRSARLGYPAIALGISPAVSAPSLIAKVGNARARELLLSPRPVDGAEAKRIGLVDVLVEEPGDVLGAAMTLARQLGGPSQLAQTHTSKWLDHLNPFLVHEPLALDASRALVGKAEQCTLLDAALRARKDRPS